MPDPQIALERYVEAVGRGDADATYGMLSSTAQRSLGKGEVKRLLREQSGEFADLSKALQGAQPHVSARARFEDGEQVYFELEHGHFLVSSADLLPGGSPRPEEALDRLRRALARKSYHGLMRVLTPATREAVEAEVRALVAGLARPDALTLRVTGDTATVAIPGGHSAKLRRERGLWRVSDFE